MQLTVTDTVTCYCLFSQALVYYTLQKFPKVTLSVNYSVNPMNGG